jgi:hypothetical protein
MRARCGAHVLARLGSNACDVAMKSSDSAGSINYLR